MYGIAGYMGEREASQLLLSGLRELDYRGYDLAVITALEAAACVALI